MELGPGREINRPVEPIPILPVEVPILDVDDGDGLVFVGETRRQLHRLADVMGVATDGNTFDIDRNRERVLELVVRLAGRNIEPGKRAEDRRQLDVEQSAFGRPISKE